MHPYTSFVALGDSFTEGLDDPGPDGMYRGWADLVATRLAAEAPGFPYANLAVRGRLLAAVVDEQVPPALEMGADLVSFAAGANDAMRRHFDAGAIAAGLDDVVARIRATGATLVMFTTAADFAERLPAGRVLRRRLESLNDLVRTTAAQHGALVVEGVGERRLADPRMWASTLHLGTHGHRLVARSWTPSGAADPAWTSALDPLPPVRWFASRTEDARWFWQHAGPWSAASPVIIRRRRAAKAAGSRTDHRRRRSPGIAG
jgi:lysophospholipase L1-like esterase